ncbi:MAG TPA: hypothetical protein VEF89_14495 [Solirubrobacteraceae bacterium]|nr:hypothetical protein [Solirubrobacteraceae bacterium]
MDRVRMWAYEGDGGALIGARLVARFGPGVTARPEVAVCLDGRLSAAQVFTALNDVRPAHAVLVEESASNLSDLHKAWPITERDTGRNRPVIAIIGDGSFHTRFSQSGTPRNCTSRS